LIPRHFVCYAAGLTDSADFHQTGLFDTDDTGPKYLVLGVDKVFGSSGEFLKKLFTAVTVPVVNDS